VGDAGSALACEGCGVPPACVRWMFFGMANQGRGTDQYGRPSIGSPLGAEAVALFAKSSPESAIPSACADDDGQLSVSAAQLQTLSAARSLAEVPIVASSHKCRLIAPLSRAQCKTRRRVIAVLWRGGATPQCASRASEQPTLVA